MGVIIGIDPGLRGGLVALDNHGEVVSMTIMPLTGKFICARSILQWLKSQGQHLDLFVELAQAMPTDKGRVSIFSYGRGFGTLIAAIEIGEISHTFVRPQVWQKECFLGTPANEKPKKRAVIAARRLYPATPLTWGPRSKCPHSGIVDALLIAEFGRRKLQNAERA